MMASVSGRSSPPSRKTLQPFWASVRAWATPLVTYRASSAGPFSSRTRASVVLPASRKTKSSAVMRAAAALAMHFFWATASASFAAIVGSSARNWLSGRVAPPCTLFTLPIRSSSFRSRRMVDSLASSASQSSCTVAVRCWLRSFMMRASLSSANIFIPPVARFWLCLNRFDCFCLYYSKSSVKINHFPSIHLPKYIS